MFLFYTSWKLQKTIGFLVLSIGQKWFNDHYLSSDKWFSMHLKKAYAKRSIFDVWQGLEYASFRCI